MAVQIKKINDRNFTVNMKPLRLDSEDNWISELELTQNEREAFFKHINAIEANAD